MLYAENPGAISGKLGAISGGKKPSSIVIDYIYITKYILYFKENELRNRKILYRRI